MPIQSRRPARLRALIARAPGGEPQGAGGAGGDGRRAARGAGGEPQGASGAGGDGRGTARGAGGEPQGASGAGGEPQGAGGAGGDGRRSARGPGWLRGRWGWLAAAVVAVFVGLAVWSQWQEVAAVRWRLQPATIALASLALGASLALVAWLWALALAGVAGVPARRGTRIWFLSNLARYVPGNVWSFVGAVELARREGAPRRATLAVMALTQLLSVGVALLAGLPVLLAEADRLGGGVAVGLGVLAAAAAVAVLARRPLLALLRRRYPEVRPRDLVPTPALAVRLTLGYALYWALTGLSFAVFVRGLYPLALRDVPIVVAGFAAAYAAGFLSLLTPAGLGVREGVLAVVLAGIMPDGAALVVAVFSRLWMTLVEIAGAGLAHLLAGAPPTAAQPPPEPGEPTLDPPDPPPRD